MSSQPDHYRLQVDSSGSGMRFDSFLAKQFPDHSRVRLRRLINAAKATVDGQRQKAAFRLKQNQIIELELAPPERPGAKPEDIPLEILHEDDDIVVVNKPTAMVVHPSKGHWSGTLAAALAFHFQNLSSVAGPTRPGIVHRLDRDTSGVILVAKNDQAHMGLSHQFEKRVVEKEYFAVSRGSCDRDEDMIERPIGVHPYQREKMALRTNHATSRDAKTFFRVTNRYRGFTSFQVFPKTGRTHQIRLHLTHIGCPILCDPLYSGHRELKLSDITKVGGSQTDQVILGRLALHAKRLRFRHPLSDLELEFSAPIPEDLQFLLKHLQEFAG